MKVLLKMTNKKVSSDSKKNYMEYLGNIAFCQETSNKDRKICKADEKFIDGKVACSK